MLQVTPHMRIYLALEPQDFRKGIDGLSGIVRDVFKRDPFSGHVFVFHNKRRTALKILLYDGQGFWLLQKRLSKGRFRRFFSSPGTMLKQLAAHELQVVLVNGNVGQLQVPAPWRPLR
jgi:hypothetical protein